MNILYLGDCRTILEQENSPFSDATEMAQAIEGAKKVTGNAAYLMRNCAIVKNDFIFDDFGAITKNLYFAYDRQQDIHVFFEIYS